jgi:hypothetical protein
VQNVCNRAGIVNPEKAHAAMAGTSVSSVTKEEYTLDSVREMSTANAHGEVPVGLTQEYWDTGDRLIIGWDAIHKLAAEQNGTPGASNNVVVKVVANANATFVEEDDTSSKAKTVKLAKRVKMAKSTALWCLLPFTPLTQEAKDKPRKVCPVNLRGEVCTANNCGSKHPKVCLVADHGKGKIPKATCLLWHMCVQFTGNFTGRRSSPKPPPGSKGNHGSNARPVKSKPDKYLAKLEAEYHDEELKARIRTQKMMSQGFTYSHVAQAQAPAHVTPCCMDPAPVRARAPAQVLRVVWTALTPDEAIAIFEETIERLFRVEKEVMTWNAEEILSNVRELALLNLLNVNDVNVGIITETEIPSSGHGVYNVEGCHSFLPLSHSELLKTAKYRVVVVVGPALATAAKIRLDIMHSAVQSIWLQLDLGAKMSAYSSQQQNRQGWPNPAYFSQQQPPTKGKVTRFLICGMYREWLDLARESTALSKVRD